MEETALGIPKSWMNRGFGKELNYFFQNQNLEELFRQKEVLELGSGYGFTLKDIVDKYGAKGYGLDLQRVEGLAHAKELDLAVGDIQNSPYDTESMDTVFSYWTFQYLEDKLKGLQEAHRVLKVGGIGILDMGDVEFQGNERVSKYISPNLADILKEHPNNDQIQLNNGYQNQDWISFPRDTDKRGDPARRCQRVIINKTSEDILEFPELIRTENIGVNYPYKKSIYTDN